MKPSVNVNVSTSVKASSIRFACVPRFRCGFRVVFCVPMKRHQRFVTTQDGTWETKADTFKKYARFEVASCFGEASTSHGSSLACLRQKAREQEARQQRHIHGTLHQTRQHGMKLCSGKRRARAVLDGWKDEPARKRSTQPPPRTAQAARSVTDQQNRG